MKARIDARFATAKDAARVLGIPRSRVKWLLALARSDFGKKASTDRVFFTAKKLKKDSKFHSTNSHGHFRAADLRGWKSQPKLKVAKTTRSAGKGRARAKTSKAVR